MLVQDIKIGIRSVVASGSVVAHNDETTTFFLSGENWSHAVALKFRQDDSGETGLRSNHDDPSRTILFATNFENERGTATKYPIPVVELEDELLLLSFVVRTTGFKKSVTREIAYTFSVSKGSSNE